MEHIKVGENIVYPLKKGWYCMTIIPNEVAQFWLEQLKRKKFWLSSSVELALHSNNSAIVVANDIEDATDTGLYRENNQFFIIMRFLNS